jgi:hypothetical protein
VDKKENMYPILKTLDNSLVDGLPYKDWLASFCSIGTAYSAWAPDLSTWDDIKWAKLQDRLYKDYAELVVNYKGQEIVYKIDSTDMCDVMNHAWGYNGKNCVRRGERGPSLQYTLYGVEDCPLSFKAMYADNSYDDAAITYNIMGINFNVPMTIDIALETWKTATGDDGTIPQKGDIVFIPMTRKLMEVVSMQPVKQLGGQLTSYKVNLSIYTPTRNRIVGEQLKESIKENTTNLMERFGEDIHTNVEDIVDDNQLSLFDSTSTEGP